MHIIFYKRYQILFLIFVQLLYQVFLHFQFQKIFSHKIFENHLENNKIILEVELFSLDGSQRFYEKISSEIENAKNLGKEVGQILKTKSNNIYKK